MVINKTSQKGTPTSGALQVNTGIPVMGLLRQLVVKPATETTMYDVSLINNDGVVVLYRNAYQGTTAEDLATPLLGIVTIKIENATADELFTFHLMTEE